MCLTTVTKKFKPNDNMIMGYKLMYRTKRDNIYMSFIRDKKMVEGKAYKANNITIRAYDDKNYDSGFHIFKYKKDMVTHYKDNYRWRVYNELPTFCRVLAWDIRAEGREDNSKIIIAKNMRIIEEV